MLTLSAYGQIILIALIAGFVLDVVTTLLNLRSLRATPPQTVAGFCDQATWERSIAYTRAKAGVDLVAAGCKLTAFFWWWFGGGFAWLDRVVTAWHLGRLGTGVVYVGLLLLLFKLFSQPFKLYQAFVVEARFGDQRTPVTTFIADRAKGLMLALMLGGPFLISVLFFYTRKGAWAWLYFWVTASAFVIFIQYLAPVLLLPLFNRFTRLPASPLGVALRAYLHRAGVPFSGIFTIDSTQRSTRANAYITGLGGKRRIVLFDTLLKRHPDAEVVALLAHEAGHHMLRHNQRTTLIAILQIGIMSALLNLAMHQPALHHDFFMDHVTLHGGFVFFILLVVPLDLVTGPLLKALTRHQEYAADRFALETLSAPEALVTALQRLSVDNLTLLTPHPWHVALHHPHPPLLWRLQAIERWRANQINGIQS
ncbi:MAG: M48 family metallopeptidase [Magnetococcales bacterium]|nr:M48 family metallopeptidase [Magnetococcales bacterium]